MINETNEESIACIIEYAPDSPVDSFLVSFEHHSEGGSKQAKFSSLEEALAYVRDTFPPVWEKWERDRQSEWR